MVVETDCSNTNSSHNSSKYFVISMSGENN